MIETRRVVNILTDFEGVHEDLLNLYEDIQRSFDPRDSVARIQGPRDLAEYAEKLSAYEEAAAQLRAVIEHITRIDMRKYRVSAPLDQMGTLAGLERHTPDEDFTHTHPAGFVLFNKVFIVRYWNQLYATLLQRLAERYPERFATLPDTPPFNGEPSYSAFTRSAANHIAPLELPNGLYCRGSLAVKEMFVTIRHLLTYFSVEPGVLVIFLRDESEGIGVA